ncbi:MAG: hypothetical protein ABFE13_15130 [Phycisphaerales bacterium]
MGISVVSTVRDKDEGRSLPYHCRRLLWAFLASVVLCASVVRRTWIPACPPDRVEGRCGWNDNEEITALSLAMIYV